MLNAKERIIGAVTVMSNEDAEKLWNVIQATFALTNAEAVPPDQDELLALQAYHNDDPEYQPFISQEELVKELGL